MSVPFCCVLFDWMWDAEKLTNIYDSPETSVTQHCFPTMGQKQHPLRSYLRATQRRSWDLRSFAYVLWVSMLFSSHSYLCHWPLIPPSVLSRIKLDHPPSAPCSKLTESRSAHDQPTAQNGMCVSAHNCTAKLMQPCLPVAGLHLGFLHFSLLLHQMVNSNWRV